MLRLLYIFFQFIILLIIASWAIQNSKPVSFVFRDITILTSTSVLIIGLLAFVIICLLLQRFMFFLKQSKQKIWILHRRFFLCINQAFKGDWRMPWHCKTMKDVVYCDKFRGAVCRLWSENFRMGKPNTSCVTLYWIHRYKEWTWRTETSK